MFAGNGDQGPGARHAARAVKGVGAERFVLAEGLGDLHKLHRIRAERLAGGDIARGDDHAARRPSSPGRPPRGMRPACHSPYPYRHERNGHRRRGHRGHLLETRSCGTSIERDRPIVDRSPLALVLLTRPSFPYAAPEAPAGDAAAPTASGRETRPVFLPTAMVIPLSLSAQTSLSLLGHLPREPLKRAYRREPTLTCTAAIAETVHAAYAGIRPPNLLRRIRTRAEHPARSHLGAPGAELTGNGSGFRLLHLHAHHPQALAFGDRPSGRLVEPHAHLRPSTPCALTCSAISVGKDGARIVAVFRGGCLTGVHARRPGGVQGLLLTGLCAVEHGAIRQEAERHHQHQAQRHGKRGHVPPLPSISAHARLTSVTRSSTTAHAT